MAHINRRGRPNLGALMYDDDTGFNIVVTTAGTFYEIKHANISTEVQGKVQASASGGTLTVPKGKYKVSFSLGGTGEASDLLEAVVHNGSTATEISGRFDFPASGMADVTIAGNGIIDVTAEAAITLKITSNTNADSLDVRTFSLVVEQVGPAS